MSRALIHDHRRLRRRALLAVILRFALDDKGWSAWTIGVVGYEGAVRSLVILAATRAATTQCRRAGGNFDRKALHCSRGQARTLSAMPSITAHIASNVGQS